MPAYPKLPTACVSQLRNPGVATLVYADDYSGSLSWTTMGVGVRDGNSTARGSVTATVNDYLGGNSVWLDGHVGWSR